MTDAITPKANSVENMVKRTIAKTNGTSTHPACPVCHIKLWISLFFDGTGNHKDMDFPSHHSNIGALFDAHVNDPKNGVIPLYYEGLGRPFEFKDSYEEVKYTSGAYTTPTYAIEGYKEDSDRASGKGFALGIQQRLEKALYEFAYQVEDWRKSRRVDEINLAVFGFSRGATEARAFLHWLKSYSKVKNEGSRLSYDGIPLNVKFLGIFDTVESVGNAGENTETDLIKTKIPAFVEKCTHIVAAHELRHAFPLTIGDGNVRHVVYPGAHSDVGGGYTPTEQGRQNKLARIALLQMLDEARGAGLKMLSVGEMKAHQQWSTKYKQSFDVPAEAAAALSSYMAEVKPAGSVPQHFTAHMKAYWAWIDSGHAIADLNQKQKTATGDNVECFKTMHVLLENLARTPAGRGSSTTSSISVSPPVADLFSNYIHDSFEGFSATGGTLQTDITVADYYHVRTIKQPS
ncbi:T6SS phospholipase effector Tle1-like catalytic domain-containing protein [Sulfuriferula nivalis]|uniref:T6SS Phospholipase effector Tle1-like catalytic domain-containing protein n=1 Tax=Sulfuriferula nivalis TaxID=2675298 RepID=A0A809REJ5_9PROT|nr:DUF2235 domain-containing protein [Sulfuriferula nivalis]BBP00035.1 hypothetical protein SFSGTM_07430 [Sulfuriferula nivalis]